MQSRLGEGIKGLRQTNRYKGASLVAIKNENLDSKLFDIYLFSFFCDMIILCKNLGRSYLVFRGCHLIQNTLYLSRECYNLYHCCTSIAAEKHSCWKAQLLHQHSCCNSVESCLVETCFGWMICFWRDIIFKSRHVIYSGPSELGVRGARYGARGWGVFSRACPQILTAIGAKLFFPSNDLRLLFWGPPNFQTFRRPCNSVRRA